MSYITAMGVPIVFPTAMCYEITALCAMMIMWVLSALCARMYFFISGYCALAISWLSLAVCTTIKAVAQAWRFVVCILPLFLASGLVRYAISVDYKAAVAVVSVDYKAAVAVGVAIGLVPRISILLLACIVDIFGHIIGTARAISRMTASIAVCASNLIMKPMKKYH